MTKYGKIGDTPMTFEIGSDEHKRLLCRFFVESHDPYVPTKLPWPDLDDSVKARLKALPIWDEAVATEAETALKVVTLGQVEPDPVMAEAIAMQGYEEERHAEVLRLLTQKYGIPVQERAAPVKPRNAEWSFMRVGYGECFDSFFAFGLFALARDSGFFPPSLVKLFEPIMQEEARHILFHVNWIAFKRARKPALMRPAYLFQRGLAIYLQIFGRVKTAVRVGASANGASQDNFAMTSAQSFGDVTMRGFLETCLAENDKRLAPYDARLLRPALAPTIARAILAVAPKGEPVAA
ncbi:MAG: ferritin-like domain-containing protein [Elusimicrobia bacterium]|nr:ferritin-like domain-containing protein [Elusimicrobiota bacterium]